MAGFNGIAGDETIMDADNASFDGTQRGGKMTTNGQLWIGSTAARHVKLGTITTSSLAIGYSSPNITINTLFPFQYVNVTTAMSPYTVTATDYYISCDATAGAITIRLPNTTTTNRPFVIKDRVGIASTNNILVTTVGGAVTIDTQTTYTMAGNFGSIQLLFNATNFEVF